jgi:hypothetical protein
LTAEVAAAKAVAVAQESRLLESTERLRRTEAQLAAALSSQANAQEEAAHMRGLADAHETQIENLLRAFNDR